MPLTDEQVADLQRNLNGFTNGNWVADVGPLLVDGRRGPHTRSRLRHVLYWLGYGDNRLTVTVDTYTKLWKRRLLVRRLRHPKSSLYFTPSMLKAGAARRKHQREQAFAAKSGDPVIIDGKAVQPWFAPWVKKIRDRGRWKGWVNSGIRTAAYSESLCYAMCGHPTCPGKCAGIYSRHNEQLPQEQRPGALDVTDYYTFADEARAVGAPFFNDLPSDRVHFSRDGH